MPEAAASAAPSSRERGASAAGGERAQILIDKYNAQAKKKPGPLGMLKKACSSKANFLMFVMNPKHWMFLILMGVAMFGTVSILTRYVEVWIGHRKFGFGVTFTSINVTILWFFTFASLFQTTIQEQIDWFRGLNTKFGKQVAQLEGDVKEMTKQCDELGACLEKFDKLREAMEEEAKKQGVALDEFQENAASVFDRMKDLQVKQEITMLNKAAADVMLGDGELGLTLKEYKRFCKRVPKRYRTLLKGREEVFKRVAGDDGIIDSKELLKFLEEIVNQQLALEAKLKEEKAQKRSGASSDTK